MAKNRIRGKFEVLRPIKGKYMVRINDNVLPLKFLSDHAKENIIHALLEGNLPKKMWVDAKITNGAVYAYNVQDKTPAIHAQKTHKAINFLKIEAKRLWRHDEDNDGKYQFRRALKNYGRLKSIEKNNTLNN